MRLYQIEKSRHRTKGIFPKIFIGRPSELSGSFTLDSSTWYIKKDENPDWLDINKLTGISLGLHHRDSIRLGWRPDFNRQGMIEIFAYWYNKSQRSFASIGFVPTKTPIQFSIQMYRKEGSVSIQVGDNIVYNFDYKFPSIGIGYLLYPYFGGDLLSPQKMKIYLTTELRYTPLMKPVAA